MTVEHWERKIRRNLRQGAPLGSAPAALDSLLATLKDQAEEIALDNKLIAERDRILDAYPCPVHGRCVPHVLDALATLKERTP